MGIFLFLLLTLSAFILLSYYYFLHVHVHVHVHVFKLTIEVLNLMGRGGGSFWQTHLLYFFIIFIVDMIFLTF